MKKKKIIFILAIILFVILLGILIGNKILNQGKFIELTYSELEEKINNKETFVLAITQTTCSHCLTYRPKLSSISKEYKIDIYYTEVDLYSDTEKEKINKLLTFTGTPTTLFIKKGEESTTSNRLVGDVSKEKVIDKLKSNGFIK